MKHRMSTKAADELAYVLGADDVHAKPDLGADAHPGDRARWALVKALDAAPAKGAKRAMVEIEFPDEFAPLAYLVQHLDGYTSPSAYRGEGFEPSLRWRAKPFAKLAEAALAYMKALGLPVIEHGYNRGTWRAWLAIAPGSTPTVMEQFDDADAHAALAEEKERALDEEKARDGR